MSVNCQGLITVSIFKAELLRDQSVYPAQLINGFVHNSKDHVIMFLVFGIVLQYVEDGSICNTPVKLQCR